MSAWCQTGVLIGSCENQVLLITLNRPDVRNALNADLVTQLRKVLQTSDSDPTVHAVVLTGAGSAFCAGADLHEIGVRDFRQMSDRVDASYAVHALLPKLTKPVIAAVNGPALAGGCGLAMSCDLVLASDRAQFGYPEVTRGLVAALVMVSLQRLVGRRKALELLLTGRRIPAQEALAIGMINEVVPHDDLLPRALGLAQDLATHSSSAVALTKQLFYRTADLPTPSALRRARDANLVMRQMVDARKGAEDFLDSTSRDTPHD